MADEAKPDATPAGDGASANSGDTPPQGGKKKIEFDADTQAFVNGKIDEAYSRAWKKAETEFGGKFADAATKIETLTKELTVLKEGGAKGKEEPPKPGQPTKEEVVAEVARLQAHINELQDGLKTIKAERDGLKETVSTSEQRRREATKLDKFLGSIPDKLTFFSPKEAYALALAEGQLQLDDKGDLVVINPATNLPRLGRDMEPMKPEEYIAEFAAKRPWMVQVEVIPGTGSAESRNVAVGKEKPKPYAEMTAAELEAGKEQVSVDVILHDDVPGEGRLGTHHEVVADHAVMGDVAVGEQNVVMAEAGEVRLVGRAMYADIFAKDIAIANQQARLAALVLQVMGLGAHAGEGKELAGEHRPGAVHEPGEGRHLQRRRQDNHRQAQRGDRDLEPDPFPGRGQRRTIRMSH